MNGWARGLLEAGYFSGCARYADHHPADGSRRVVVQAALGAQGDALSMILDTGAPWNVVSLALLEEMGVGCEVVQERQRLMIRGLWCSGPLVRASFTLLAGWGQDLVVDGSFLAIDDADVPVSGIPLFLGYGGCLEWIRFALDPTENLFCFGAAG